MSLEQDVGILELPPPEEWRVGVPAHQPLDLLRICVADIARTRSGSRRPAASAAHAGPKTASTTRTLTVPSSHAQKVRRNDSAAA